MTTAATIVAQLILDSNKYSQGVKAAGTATDRLKGKVNSLMSFVQRNAVAIDALGTRFQQAGKRMTQFITLPILGFFALLIKKAIDADTALGKLAKESMAKLNASLAKLGEKFLPVFIKIVDWLTKMIDKFNQASPKMQGFILILIGLIALAGPLTSFIGTIMSVVSAISTIGKALTTATPAVAVFGTTLWAALVPLLPIIIAIIALVAGLAFVIWAFATDFMGVTTAAKQLWFIIKYEFKQGWEYIKSKTQEGLNWFNSEWKKSNAVWANNQKQWSEIQSKLFKLAMTTMQKAIMDFVTRVNAKFSELRNWAINTWNAIASAFNRVFGGIANFANRVFQSIVAGIQWVIEAVHNLIAALEDIVLPDALTPGSPTPFEKGLRGISDAMNSISHQSLPQLNYALAAPQGVATVGTAKTINITDNRRFAAGISAEAMRVALDDKLQGLTAALEAG